MLDERIHNATILRIVLQVWPEAESLNTIDLSRLYGDVRNIIEGLPTPERSRLEREAVKAAWVDAAPRSGSCL